ncbi:MAG TPA: PPOX class F420-dependent oxidoreductase, partial [Blastocatellia bacterium]|nr:PPOX class F420-dependent oxidoreductase [Blastocatellia bacterium]
MNQDELALFAKEKYLNLETFRKNGTPVDTPVWFAEDRGTFYVYSRADAGKVKRVRNSPRARIAPCDVRGKLKGTWVDAEARVAGEAEAARGQELLNKK